MDIVIIIIVVILIIIPNAIAEWKKTRGELWEQEERYQKYKKKQKKKNEDFEKKLDDLLNK